VSPFSFGTKILGGGAAVLLLFLLIGYLLPADWEAEATRVIQASPEEVRPFLDSPEGWQKWTPWPQNGVTRSGPQHGAGATLSWDDPDLGSGSFTLERVDPDEVQYAVDVGDGSMRTHGRITLTPENGGVRVFWREEGDLGRNPLMGYWALSMARAQGDELTKGLERLDGLVTGAGPGPGQPADSSDRAIADSARTR
jgi:hypothetical protein